MTDPRSNEQGRTGTRTAAVFADWPAPGRVLSRMFPALPGAEARRLYEGMIADAVAAARECAADRALLYWAEMPENEREWLRVAPAVEARRQYGPDAGARLRDAFTALLVQPGDRAVVFCPDCPALDAAVLDRALAALAAADVVLGPTTEGGLCLVGLSRPAPELFGGFEWGAAHALMPGNAIDDAPGVFRLAPLEPLDTPERLVRLLALAVAPPALPPLRTVEALREMGLLPGDRPS